MNRIVPLLFLSSSLFASAFVQVTCPGSAIPITATGVSPSVSCFDPVSLAFADASADSSTFTLNVDGDSHFPSFNPITGDGLAGITTQQIVTITGGTGNATLNFTPTFLASAGEGNLGIACLNLAVNGQAIDYLCGAPGFSLQSFAHIPFTFGTPFPLDFSASGHANGGVASLTFGELDPTTITEIPSFPAPGSTTHGTFYISNDTGLLGTDFAVTVTSTPEPSSGVLFGIGIALLVLRKNPAGRAIHAAFSKATNSIFVAAKRWALISR